MIFCFFVVVVVVGAWLVRFLGELFFQVLELECNAC